MRGKNEIYSKEVARVTKIFLRLSYIFYFRFSLVQFCFVFYRSILAAKFTVDKYVDSKMLGYTEQKAEFDKMW